MDADSLISLHPRLYHMAAEGSWDSIREHGLLSTRTIVDSSNLSPTERAQILGTRRPHSVVFEHPTLGSVSIRDQGPLRVPFLEAALTDMSVSDWLEVLNDRVFFWPTEEKLDVLLGAQRYRNRVQDVLIVDTRSLLDAHLEGTRLSPINSGATLYPNAASRGRGTFSPIDLFDYEASRRRRGRANAIVELAVLDGVPDIANHVIRAERRLGASVIARLA